LQAATLTAIDHFVNCSRTEELARIAILFRTSWMTDVRLQDVQMAWLIFIVYSAGIVDVSELVERQLTIENGWSGRGNPAIVILAQLLHPCVAWSFPISIP